jgi:hypothetical protein
MSILTAIGLLAYRSGVATPIDAMETGTDAFSRPEIERECIDRSRFRTPAQPAKKSQASRPAS